MSRSARSVAADSLFLAVALLWAGMLIGVSFLATPVKFGAPGLSLPVALEVGRVTFHLFSRVEWGLAAALLLVALPRRTATLLALPLTLAVAAQAVWLLPALDARIDAVAAGTPLPPSAHHTVYAAMEAAKLLLLATAAVLGLRTLRRR